MPGRKDISSTGGRSRAQFSRSLRAALVVLLLFPLILVNTMRAQQALSNSPTTVSAKPAASPGLEDELEQNSATPAASPSREPEFGAGIRDQATKHPIWR